MTSPEFIDANPEAIAAQVLETFEDGLGKVLLPAQPERLLVNVAAYRELLVRLAIQKAAERCLVNYSDGTYLDQLGALNGATRLPASRASTTLKFLLRGAQSTLIPQGTRVSAQIDGQIWFSTNEAATIPASSNSAELRSVDVVATAIRAGTEFNDFTVGQIKAAIDPLPNGVTVSNITPSTGGGNEETDEQYRERIKLAPNQFNTAGSRGSYAFYARSADASIIDVSVQNGGAVNVEVYLLTKSGLPSPEILAKVDDVLNADNIRPLTDIVRVLSPSEVSFAVDIGVTLFSSADATALKPQLESALGEYIAGRKAKIGLDVLRAQLIQSLKFDGVYDVTVNSPASDVIISSSQWPNPNSVSLNIVGENDG